MALTFLPEVIGVGLSTILGVLVTQGLMNGASYPVSWLFTLFIGWGLGVGLSSLIWFIAWCWAAPGSPFLSILIEIVTILLLLLCSNKVRTPGPKINRDSTQAVRWISILATLSGAGAVFFFVRFIVHAPYGGWDAWAIWNLHARALFVGGGRFWKTELFKLAWSHPDYPLLLSLSVARLWFLTGAESPSAPAITAFLYTFGTAGVLAIGLSQLKNRVSGTLALAVLLASTKFLWLGLQEYADVPMGFYLLTAFVTLAQYELSGETRFLILTGLSAGFAAWTKDEGWMFLGCLVASRVVLTLVSKPWHMPISTVTAFLVGAFPVLIVAAAYKYTNPAHSYVLGWYLSKSAWIRAFDATRLLYILKNFGRVLWNLQNWFVSPIAVLAIYAGLVGFERDKAMRKASATGLLTICLMLVGYFCVYATTTADLKWYLNTSLERLCMQLWPSLLLCLFLITRAPYHSARGDRTEHHKV